MLSAQAMPWPELRLDSHYLIGRLHLFCQDYALHGWRPVPHLILADGCSAAPDSDIGARLLALDARRLLSRFARPANGEERRVWHWTLGRRIVRRAARQARDLGLDPTVLDATLLVAWCDGATVHVHLYGDGCLAVRRADGAWSAIRVEYAENAPYYLSYLLDPERQALYREAVGEPATAQSVHYQNASGDTVHRQPFDTPTVFSFDLTVFPLVALATDGLDSFLWAETGERLDLGDVARTLLDFPSLEGTFVQRQLYRTLVAYAERDAFNGDDIGLGAFARVTDATLDAWLQTPEDLGQADSRGGKRPA